MKTILVTGAAGFIGSNFVRLLLAESDSYRIIAYDALTYAGNLANLDDLKDNERFEFIKGDICDTALVDQVISRVDIVVNFAAESHVDRSILSAAEFIRTNIGGTQILADTALKHKIEPFVQVSTDEVYGSLGKTGLFTEQSPIRPNSPYSASKTGADLLMQAYHHTFGFPVVITRCSNNYGPYLFPEKLIPLFVTNLLEGKKVPVYGDGMQVRDWIHVEDHRRAVWKVMEKGADGEVYNIGGDNEQYNIDITKLILKHLGKDETYIEHVTDRLGHDRRYAIDPAKTRREINWQPQIDFQQGMTDTIQWYLDNQPWWSAIKSGEYMHYYEKQYGKR